MRGRRQESLREGTWSWIKVPPLLMRLASSPKRPQPSRPEESLYSLPLLRIAVVAEKSSLRQQLPMVFH